MKVTLPLIRWPFSKGWWPALSGDMQPHTPLVSVRRPAACQAGDPVGRAFTRRALVSRAVGRRLREPGEMLENEWLLAKVDKVCFASSLAPQQDHGPRFALAFGCSHVCLVLLKNDVLITTSSVYGVERWGWGAIYF